MIPAITSQCSRRGFPCSNLLAPLAPAKNASKRTPGAWHQNLAPGGLSAEPSPIGPFLGTLGRSPGPEPSGLRVFIPMLRVLDVTAETRGAAGSVLSDTQEHEADRSLSAKKWKQFAGERILLCFRYVRPRYFPATRRQKFYRQDSGTGEPKIVGTSFSGPLSPILGDGDSRSDSITHCPHGP